MQREQNRNTAVGGILEKVVEQVHDPWLGHAIPSLRTAVLRGLPLSEPLERGRIRRVELEATRSLVSIESSTLSVDLFDRAPVTVDVCVVAEVQLDDG